MHKPDLDPATSKGDCSRRQLEMLRGTEIDIEHEDGKKGFEVENPNFDGGCVEKWIWSLEQETNRW